MPENACRNVVEALLAEGSGLERFEIGAFIGWACGKDATNCAVRLLKRTVGIVAPGWDIFDGDDGAAVAGDNFYSQLEDARDKFIEAIVPRFGSKRHNAEEALRTILKLADRRGHRRGISAWTVVGPIGSLAEVILPFERPKEEPGTMDELRDLIHKNAEIICDRKTRRAITGGCTDEYRTYHELYEVLWNALKDGFGEDAAKTWWMKCVKRGCGDRLNAETLVDSASVKRTVERDEASWQEVGLAIRFSVEWLAVIALCLGLSGITGSASKDFVDELLGAGSKSAMAGRAAFTARLAGVEERRIYEGLFGRLGPIDDKNEAFKGLVKMHGVSDPVASAARGLGVACDHVRWVIAGQETFKDGKCRRAVEALLAHESCGERFTIEAFLDWAFSNGEGIRDLFRRAARIVAPEWDTFSGFDVESLPAAEARTRFAKHVGAFARAVEGGDRAGANAALLDALKVATRRGDKRGVSAWATGVVEEDLKEIANTLQLDWTVLGANAADFAEPDSMNRLRDLLHDKAAAAMGCHPNGYSEDEGRVKCSNAIFGQAWSVARWNMCVERGCANRFAGKMLVDANEVERMLVSGPADPREMRLAMRLSEEWLVSAALGLTLFGVTKKAPDAKRFLDAFLGGAGARMADRASFTSRLTRLTEKDIYIALLSFDNPIDDADEAYGRFAGLFGMPGTDPYEVAAKRLGVTGDHLRWLIPKPLPAPSLVSTVGDGVSMARVLVDGLSDIMKEKKIDVSKKLLGDPSSHSSNSNRYVDMDASKHLENIVGTPGSGETRRPDYIHNVTNAVVDRVKDFVVSGCSESILDALTDFRVGCLGAKICNWMVRNHGAGADSLYRYYASSDVGGGEKATILLAFALLAWLLGPVDYMHEVTTALGVGDRYSTAMLSRYFVGGNAPRYLKAVCDKSESWSLIGLRTEFVDVVGGDGRVLGRLTPPGGSTARWRYLASVGKVYDVSKAALIAAVEMTPVGATEAVMIGDWIKERGDNEGLTRRVSASLFRTLSEVARTDRGFYGGIDESCVAVGRDDFGRIQAFLVAPPMEGGSTWNDVVETCKMLRRLFLSDDIRTDLSKREERESWWVRRALFPDCVPSRLESAILHALDPDEGFRWDALSVALNLETGDEPACLEGFYGSACAFVAMAGMLRDALDSTGLVRDLGLYWLPSGYEAHGVPAEKLVRAMLGIIDVESDVQMHVSTLLGGRQLGFFLGVGGESLVVAQLAALVGCLSEELEDETRCRYYANAVRIADRAKTCAAAVAGMLGAAEIGVDACERVSEYCRGQLGYT